MSLLCSCCKNYTLKVKSSVELYPDKDYDESSIQIVKCSSCQFEGIAIYQESRRGSLDSESISHIAYKVPESKLKYFHFLVDNNHAIDVHGLITSDKSGKKYESFHIRYLY